jgi:hypothetical protein
MIRRRISVGTDVRCDVLGGGWKGVSVWVGCREERGREPMRTTYFPTE